MTGAALGAGSQRVAEGVSSAGQRLARALQARPGSQIAPRSQLALRELEELMRQAGKVKEPVAKEQLKAWVQRHELTPDELEAALQALHGTMPERTLEIVSALSPYRVSGQIGSVATIGNMLLDAGSPKLTAGAVAMGTGLAAEKGAQACATVTACLAPARNAAHARDPGLEALGLTVFDPDQSFTTPKVRLQNARAQAPGSHDPRG